MLVLLVISLFLSRFMCRAQLNVLLSQSGQSPINLETSTAEHKHFPPLELQHPIMGDTIMNVTNFVIPGVATVMIRDRSVKRPRLVGGPLDNEFEFMDYHFHWRATDSEGSLHEIDGEKFAMEAHFDFFNTKYKSPFEISKQQHPDGFLVLTFSLQAGGFENPEFQKLVNVLPNIVEAGTTVTLPGGEAFAWVPNPWPPNDYFFYRGSSTSPPYKENQFWLNYRKPIQISSSQVAEFRKLMDKEGEPILDNGRDVQPLNGRTVIYSEP